MIVPMLMSVWVAVEVPVANMGELQAALGAAQPGDEIIVAAGTYTSNGNWTIDLQGTEADPIIVRAADGASVLMEGTPAQNLIDISGTWYEWRGFEMTGSSHGVRIATSSHAVFADLHIHDTDGVGISCNRPDNTYEDITIRGLQIYNTGGAGECMYLGCNDAACTMFDSLIEYNWCHDTGGDQGDGIELKTGSYNTIIRHNVIHDVNYPGITMYGTQGQAPNVVEGNIVWNVVDNGIQTVGDVTVRNNVVFNTGNNGIHVKPSQGEVPSGVVIEHNTIVNPGGVCFRGNEFPGANGNVIANNAFLCPGGDAMRFATELGDAVMAGNAVNGALVGVMGGTFDVGDPATELEDPMPGHDAYPTEGSGLRDAGDAAQGIALDFNCDPREDASPDAGAYEWSQVGNPGWLPVPGFKPECAGGPGGSDDSGGETGDETSGDTTGGDTTGGTGGGPVDGTSPDDGSATGPIGATGSDGNGDGPGLDDGGGESGCGCQSTPGPNGWALLMLLALWPIRRRNRA